VKDSYEVDAVPPIEVPRNSETNNERSKWIFTSANTAVVAFGRRSNSRSRRRGAPACAGARHRRSAQPDQGNGTYLNRIMAGDQDRGPADRRWPCDGRPGGARIRSVAISTRMGCRVLLAGGPESLRHNDWFYLITAGPPTGHMVIAARSRSIYGPWENAPGNPLVRTQSAAEKWWSARPRHRV